MSKLKKQRWYEKIPVIEMRELINNYVSHTLVPSEQKEAILNKINNPKPKKSKSAKALSFLFLFNFPSKSKNFITPIYWLTISSMLIFMNLPVESISTKNQIISKIFSNEISENKIELEKSNVVFSENKPQDITEDITIDEFVKNNYLPAIRTTKLENSNISHTNFDLINYNNTYNSIENLQINTSAEVADLNMNFEMKYNTLFNLGNTNINAPDEAILKDYSFGLWYSISNNLKIGAEFRQESFTKLESNSINPSINVIAFNMNCWEMAMKFKSSKEIFNANPIMQLNLGAGKHGLISRISAGLMIPITDEMNVITTGELSSLIYSLDSQIHSTEKIGFNIGFNLHLK